MSDRPLPPAGYRNIRIELSYDGRAFFGYQWQPHVKTAQGVLMEAWKTLTQDSATLYACSRLDAGVHAHHFVLNVHSATTHSDERILRALNGILHQKLQEPISVYNVTTVEDNFHARFDAVGKHYRYLLWHGYGLHAFLSRRAWVLRTRNLSSELTLHFRRFEGTHDFSAFRAQDCSAKKTIRHIERVDCWQHPRFPELYIIDFWGEGFLKNMIRNIVGTTVNIATGKMEPRCIEEAFAHGERTRMGECAPAHGLCLQKVYYDTHKFTHDALQGARQWIPS